MKKKFTLVMMLIVGIVTGLSAQKKIVFSEDKSHASVVIYTAVVTTDTLKTYVVSDRAKYYVNEEVITRLLLNSDKVFALPDSLVPSWTHLFGKETYKTRQLELARYGDIIYSETGEYRTPPLMNRVMISLIIYCLILIISAYFLNGFSWILSFILSTSFITVSSAIALLAISSFKDSHKGLIYLGNFDSLFLIFMLILPALYITIFIKEKHKDAKKHNQIPNGFDDEDNKKNSKKWKI